MVLIELLNIEKKHTRFDSQFVLLKSLQIHSTVSFQKVVYILFIYMCVYRLIILKRMGECINVPYI